MLHRNGEAIKEGTVLQLSYAQDKRKHLFDLFLNSNNAEQ